MRVSNQIQRSLVAVAFCIAFVCAVFTAPVQAETYFFHNDHLGTPQALTGVDQEIAWEVSQEPFGEGSITTSTVVQNIRFPGQYADVETGLSYNYFRTYDSSTGRYTQSDPIGLGGGINTYGYAYQNPLSYTDPTGEFVPMAVWWAARAAWAARSAWAAYNVAQSAVDLYETVGVFANECSSTTDKVVAGGLFLAGIVLPNAKAVPNSVNKPLLGSNAKVKKDRTNTDLDPVHDRATAKSIFRNQTKGQKIKQFENRNGEIIRRADDGTQIRMNRGGSTRIDLPGRGDQPNGETIHFNP